MIEKLGYFSSSNARIDVKLNKLETGSQLQFTMRPYIYRSGAGKECFTFYSKASDFHPDVTNLRNNGPLHPDVYLRNKNCSISKLVSELENGKLVEGALDVA